MPEIQPCVQHKVVFTHTFYLRCSTFPPFRSASQAMGEVRHG